MRRGLAAALALAALGALVTGCAGVPAAGSARVQLVVADYRDIGYRSLLREYEREHPGVTIVERTTEYWQHHANLESQLATFISQPSRPDLSAGALKNETEPPKKKG